jgi:S-adenosylmethionine synthetase
MVKMLNLIQSIYRQTAAYGHFGRDDIELPWVKINKIDLMK